MNSSILRSAATIRAAARRPAIATTVKALSARSYATPSEEPDPQLDGYPQLPWIQRQTLPARGWDDMLERRNFGDTLHEQEEVLSMWGPDAPPIEPHVALRRFLIAASGFVALGLTIKYGLAPEPPAVRREYPYNGLVTELGGLEENKARSDSLEDSE